MTGLHLLIAVALVGCGKVPSGAAYSSEAMTDTSRSLASATPVPTKQEPPVITQASAATGLPLPSCAEVRASALVGGALADAFDRRYPSALKGEAAVEAVALDEAGVENAVRYLACAATLTEGDVGVVESGLALFASRRHGARALAALDRVAKGGGVDAPGAARFAEQVRGYLAGPGE